MDTSLSGPCAKLKMNVFMQHTVSPKVARDFKLLKILKKSSSQNGPIEQDTLEQHSKKSRNSKMGEPSIKTADVRRICWITKCMEECILLAIIRGQKGPQLSFSLSPPFLGRLHITSECIYHPQNFLSFPLLKHSAVW